mmetsp:Transcript_28369/g.65223  ORF Transcript_28369/g.65223 Transcript_28369/m.65223 type:complete len:245 (+) Transcript_28369:517-1251(+)
MMRLYLQMLFMLQELQHQDVLGSLMGPCAHHAGLRTTSARSTVGTRRCTFQTVVSPNGLITDFFGPVLLFLLGRRGDGYMLRASQFQSRMQRLCVRVGQPFYVYGDPAYPQTPYILHGFKGLMTAAQKEFSTSMSASRAVMPSMFSTTLETMARKGSAGRSRFFRAAQEPLSVSLLESPVRLIMSAMLSPPVFFFLLFTSTDDDAVWWKMGRLHPPFASAIRSSPSLSRAALRPRRQNILAPCG